MSASVEPKPLEVTYDAAEMRALGEASKIVLDFRIDREITHCFPALQKLRSVSSYLERRQEAVVAKALADPDTDGAR